MKLTSLTVFITIINFSYGQLGCRDENNNLVDWYYLYKLPLDKTKDDGFRYTYITSETISDQNNSWLLSSKTITDTNSTPGVTLAPLYENSESLIALLYNDEPPNDRTDGTNGHTKGVVASDSNQGFWMVHSVPHFPSNLDSNAYAYPDTGKHYGQSFLCITLNATELEKVGIQLTFNEPHIYSKNLPNDLQAQFPNLVRASDMNFVTDPPYWNQLKLTSIGGVEFQSFAKNRHFNKELYSDWVAPVLNADLYVETWRHGPGNLPTFCNRSSSVYNVKDIDLKLLDIKPFSTMKDHSKWAVGYSNESWICVGDVNRQEHQMVRGGGTVCLKSKKISTIYRSTIEDYEPCHN